MKFSEFILEHKDLNEGIFDFFGKIKTAFIAKKAEKLCQAYFARKILVSGVEICYNLESMAMTIGNSGRNIADLLKSSGGDLNTFKCAYRFDIPKFENLIGSDTIDVSKSSYYAFIKEYIENEIVSKNIKWSLTTKTAGQFPSRSSLQATFTIKGDWNKDAGYIEDAIFKILKANTQGLKSTGKPLKHYSFNTGYLDYLTKIYSVDASISGDTLEIKLELHIKEGKQYEKDYYPIDSIG